MLFSRKTFLCGSAATAATVPLFMHHLAAEAATDTILVTILQDGGCDGFNTIIPLQQYGRYAQLRQIPGGTATLAVQQTDIQTAGTAFESNTTIASNQAVTYAMHPAMTTLRGLYGAGKVAVLLGVGIPPDDKNRTSHEVGKFDWHTASINKLGYSNQGWLGQAIDTLPSSGTLPLAASLNYSSPIMLRGAQTSPLVMGGDISGFAIPCGTSGTDCATRLTGMTSIDTYTGPSSAAEFSRALSTQTSAYVAAVKTYANAAPGTDYPSPGSSGLRNQLKQIARLIVSGAPTRAYFASQGGYDTHSGQNNAGSHPTLLGDLSDGIGQFMTYLAGKGLSQRVVIMTMTDFGRRLQANSTAGTDHGTASVSFVIGDRVKGGVYGQYPDLTKLDSAGNVLVQVDFRNHISDLITAFGADPKPIVGSSYPSLGYLL